jgi:alpha-glucosidase
MRAATLDCPPLFHVTGQAGARLDLASDTAARAHIFVLEDDLVRLMVLPEGTLRHKRSWTVAPGQDDIVPEGRDRFDISEFSCPAFRVQQDDPNEIIVETGRIRLALTLRNLACRWSVWRAGQWVEAMRDRPTQAYDFGWWGGKVRHYLAREPGEQYFGLGERSGASNRAGRRIRLSNIDAMGYDAETSDPLYKHIPFYLTRRPDSGLSFGLFYDTLSDCTFDFGCEHSNYHGPYRYFSADHGDLDLYFIGGESVQNVVRRFTWLTGRPAATPDWAMGYSGSTMSYTDAPDAQVAMGKFLSDLKTHDIPCGSFHLSSGYTSIGLKRYVFHWNREKFPDPKAFVKSYADAGIRLIANIKPALLMDHPQFQAVAEAGLFLSDAAGAPVLEQFWDAPGAYLDFTNPATAVWWKQQIKSELLDLGVESTWNDNNEYEICNPCAGAYGFGARFMADEMKPLQTLLMLRASREAQLEHSPGKIPFLVSRSGAAGMQRYAQTWSGDNYTSWKTLKWNIPMALGLAMSGVSNVGHDIGGFAGPFPDPELFARWFGFGVFMPRLSVHSWKAGGKANEPWMYPEILDDIRELMALRTRLTPYLAETLARYRNDYEPAIRPLFYDFPDDAHSWNENELFMLGEAILVAPVVTPGALTREILLPTGSLWRDGWSDREFEGGETICLEAPINKPPFLIRLNAPHGSPDL